MPAASRKEPLFSSLLAFVFFGYFSLKTVAPKNTPLSSSTFRHIVWWIFYACVIVVGVTVYFLDVIAPNSEPNSLATLYSRIALVTKTSSLIVCLIWGASQILRARKRDHHVTDLPSSSFVRSNISAPSSSFSPAALSQISSRAPFSGAALTSPDLPMLAPALREPPYSLCFDDLAGSFSRESSRVRKSWARSLRLAAALTLFIFLAFLTLEVMQRVEAHDHESENVSQTVFLICNIVYTTFLALLYATSSAVIGAHAMSCLHLSTALDSMRERLRRVSPVSAASIALLFQAHDEDDDDEEGGHYHPLYDEDNFRGSRSESSDLTTMSSSSSSNTSRARRRDDESVDALGMSHPFASVDIAAIQRAMAQKHGLPLQSSNSGSASAPPTTSPSDNANFSLNSTVGSILLPVSEESAEMESDQSSVPSSISATTSSLKDKSVIRLSAFQPQSSSPTRSGAPSSLLGASQSSVVPARPSNSSAAPFFGRGQDDPNDPQTPLIVLDAVSTDLVHFRKALRRHNKSWGRMVIFILLAYFVQLAVDAVIAFSHHSSHNPTPAPSTNSSSVSSALISGAPAFHASATSTFVRLFFTFITLLVCIPAIILPPAMVSTGVQQLMVTLYIFADDHAASTGASIASSHPNRSHSSASSPSASADSNASFSPVFDASTSQPPALSFVRSLSESTTAAPSIPASSPFPFPSQGSESQAVQAAMQHLTPSSMHEIVSKRITALMSRLSSLVAVDALSASIGSVSANYSFVGGIMFVLVAAALVLIPELISDSPFGGRN